MKSSMAGAYCEHLEGQRLRASFRALGSLAEDSNAAGLLQTGLDEHAKVRACGGCLPWAHAVRCSRPAWSQNLGRRKGNAPCGCK